MVRTSRRILTAVTSCAGMALLVLGASGQTVVSPASDPTVAAWARPAVTMLRSKGILVNFPDGQFHGDQSVTRYEAFVSIKRLVGSLPPTDSGKSGGAYPGMRGQVVLASWAEARPIFGQDQFKDIDPIHWAYEATTDLQQKGILLCYPDGYAKGKRNLTRAELATIVTRLISLLPHRAGDKIPTIAATGFADAAGSTWWKQAALSTQATGVMCDDANGAFHPNAAMTRNEFAAYLQRMVDAVQESSGSLSASRAHS